VCFSANIDDLYSGLFMPADMGVGRWKVGWLVGLLRGQARSMQADGFCKYRRSLFTAPTADVCQRTTHIERL